MRGQAAFIPLGATSTAFNGRGVHTRPSSCLPLPSLPVPAFPYVPSVITAVAAKPRADSSPPKKLSKVEGLKVSSNQLRFPLAEQLQNDEIFITENAVQIMKFHGSYQQDDRDKRASGQQKKYQFMLRLKMPAGEFPAALYQALDDISTKYGNNTLRATTRCAWQIHGVLKSDLKPVFSAIMNAGGSCIGACGDLSRNVMCTPAPLTSELYKNARFVSAMLGELFAPQTGAFSEIWLDGEKAASLEFWKKDLDMNSVQEIMRFDNGNGVVYNGKEEPIYGETYLPRKFKIGVTVPGDNSIDIYTQDIGIVCIPDAAGKVVGYNIIVGGGMGRTHRKATTFARTGDHLGYVPADKLWEACKAIVAAQRDHGNRSVRANARMKYLVDKLGIDSFRTLVETYFGEPFESFREIQPWRYMDWLGWHEQGDGNLFLGLFIENGRIKDEADFKLRTALRRIIDAYEFDMVVSPNQNIILKNITPNQKNGIEAILKEHNVRTADEYLINKRLSMACPAMPLCGLAITEAERVMPDMVARMDTLFKKNGLDVPVTIRMTGCPNGCARPYMAELGLVGSGQKSYQLWLGGCPHQTRLAWPYLDRVKDVDLEGTLTPVLTMYQQKSTTGEAFGDFCHRMGKSDIATFAEHFNSAPIQVNGAPPTLTYEAPVKARTARKKSTAKPRPRLTVSDEIMERLKNIAALRDMSASRVADEIISAYLSGVEDEDLLGDEMVI
ncbi:Sulfite reductase [ferredoxin] SIR [Chondrus crispus]|uniref:assimilatory sulfite reductase (ferredoxin) n=1 Tax=Chondrus crispus TaxID=2769 RepID=R7QB76_CHOCR|nr:Sulfite reductase [ferredoxin] SIR [Chondrus crispus]CDF34676.1 Sulfite reductase [ferredoxin] SIR [Chondrus crispus]|eukprot:XP_005714495.1 Sulfite reductase [ferredoxin] SIR [Chondrus crispus]